MQGLRPTPDRVRETLFNWLNNYIIGARCLDLFSGSGILGIEALSRGAGSIVFVEQHSAAIDTLQGSLKALGAEAVTVHKQEVLQWLRQTTQSFDIIFLDPPFGMRLLDRSLALLLDSSCITDQTLVYVESDSSWQPAGNITLLKQAHAGKVNYALIKRHIGAVK